MGARILALGDVRVGKMKTKSNYLMVFLIITFGVDVLDRHMKIEYITVPIILIIMLIVFVQIIYYSFFKNFKNNDSEGSSQNH